MGPKDKSGFLKCKEIGGDFFKNKILNIYKKSRSFLLMSKRSNEELFLV